MVDMSIKVGADVTRVIMDIERAVGDSEDLTMVPPANAIRYAGATYTITADKKAAVNGTPVANTSGVVLLKLVKQPKTSTPPGVYQQNSGGSWYGPVSPATGGPDVSGDPSVASGGSTGVPPQAAAVGFNTLTFGGEGIIIDGNWYKVNNDNVTQKGQGVVCAGGSNGYNAHLKSKTGFSKGGYFEAELFWTGVYNGWGQPGSTGWPSWWLNSVESEQGTQGYSAEPDIMEYWGDTKWGGAIHSWYQPQGNKLTIGHENPVTNFDHSKPHKYGMLWVPATDSTKGYAHWYFDGVWMNAMDITWNKYTGALPPTDSSVIDVGHQHLILGSGAGNPMTVNYAKVWQRDASGNIKVR